MAFARVWRPKAVVLYSRHAAPKGVPGWHHNTGCAFGVTADLYESPDGETQRFPRRVRLSKPADFRRVFALAAKSNDPYFTVLYRPNELGYARLGLAVSRKAASLAVARNRIKRVVRESFRLTQYRLPALDIVVIARPQITRQHNAVLFLSLERHWRRLLSA